MGISTLRRLVFLAACSASSMTLAGNLPQDFTDAYEPAVAKIQKVYNYVTVRGSVVREFPLKREATTQEYTLRNSAKKSRLDIKTTASKNGALAVGTVEVYLATPEASFYGIGDNGTPAIDTSQELTYAEATLRINKAFPIDEPYALASGGTVLEMLKNPQINIGEVKKIQHQGKQYVKIIYDRPIGGGADNLDALVSYVLLSPSEGWAVREFSRSTGRGADMKTTKGKVTYSDVRDGVPIVERIETWQYVGADQVLSAHELVSVTKFEPGDPLMVYFGADGFK
jgi:hypothetical protein